MRPRTEVKAVWDEDLRELLASLSLLDDATSGRLRCAVCGRAVDMENLGAVISAKSKVQVTCDDTECVCRATAR